MMSYYQTTSNVALLLVADVGLWAAASISLRVCQLDHWPFHTALAADSESRSGSPGSRSH